LAVLVLALVGVLAVRQINAHTSTITDGIIHGCVHNNNQSVKIVGATDACSGNETEVDWQALGGTLDEAYDSGGAGGGRTITADTGAVSIAGTDGLSIDGDLEFVGAQTIDTTAGNLTLNAAASTNQLVLDSAGNVGIGTASAGEALSVDGNLEFVGAQTIDTTAGNLTLNAAASTNQLVLGSDGNVGIGTASAGEALSVDGNLEFVGAQTIDTTAGNLTLNAAASTNQLVLGSSGNVGIGTASAGEALSVDGNLEFVGAQTIDTTAGNLTLNAAAVTDQLVLDSDGNVGIGVADPAFALHLIGGSYQAGVSNIFSGDDSATLLTLTPWGTTPNYLKLQGNLPASSALNFNSEDNELSPTIVSRGIFEIQQGSEPTWTAKSAWNLPDVGVNGIPAFADLDADGDYDVLIGEDGGVVHGYENTGSNSSPVWTDNNGWDTPDVGGNASPAFADLDNDGDYDLMIGNALLVVEGYENTGTNISPTWTAKTAWDVTAAATNTNPIMADLDNDGDYDLIVGIENGRSQAYENTGSNTSPTWTVQNAWNPSLLGSGGNPAPTLADLDNDGDFDVILGRANSDEAPTAFENTGSNSLPAWTLNSSWGGPVVSGFRDPDFIDLDNDGDFDMVIGATDGVSYAYENTGAFNSSFAIANGNVGIRTLTPGEALTVDGNLEFVGAQGINTTTDNLTVGAAGNANQLVLDSDGNVGIGIADPAFALHLTGDGYQAGVSNIFSGDDSATLLTLIQGGTSPNYLKLQGSLPASSALNFKSDNNELSPTIVSRGIFEIQQASEPTWTAKSAWDLPDVGGEGNPAFADLDNDGDYDVMIGENLGVIHAYENTGSNSSPIWTNKNAWDTPDTGGNASPALADLDNDGDYDLLTGTSTSLTVGYENTGTVAAPVWVAKTAWDVVHGLAGSDGNPAMADLDNDGDYDLIIGGGVNAIAFENTGSITSPTWTAKSAWDPPSLGGSGTNASPALADIDNDGDYDLIMGRSNSDQAPAAFENTGSNTSPAWTANTAWNGPSVSIYRDPAWVDLDNDGDFDMVIGATDGVSYAYENTGAINSAFAIANGNVGIGTTSPGEALSVDGNLEFVGAQTIDTTAGNLTLNAAASTNQLVLDSGGNVGIGTASPGSALAVLGYVQLDLTSGAPASADCDAAAEHGRMKVDASASLLYICMSSGWVSK
jgi:hypothetical protein